MKKIELHKANRLSHGATMYTKGVKYSVSDTLFKTLMDLKNPRGVGYFRVPLTKAQEKAIVDRANRVPEGGGLPGSRVNEGANVIKVDGSDVEEEKPPVIEEPLGVNHDDDDDDGVQV